MIICPSPRQHHGRLIPCGTCPVCRDRKAAEWSIRLEMEAEGKNGVFLTLSWSDEYKPDFLEKGPLQAFLKRLRRYFEYHYGVQDIRYFGCGEYGDKFGRPHYHLIVLSKSEKIKELPYSELWSFGFVDVGTVTQKSIRYVSNYVMKKMSFVERKTTRIDTDGKPIYLSKYISFKHNPAFKFHKDGEIIYAPPFQVYSKGIGKDWMKAHKEQLIKDMCLYKDNKKYKLPRYFTDHYMKQNNLEIRYLTATMKARNQKDLEDIEYCKEHDMTLEELEILKIDHAIDRVRTKFEKRNGTKAPKVFNFRKKRKKNQDFLPKVVAN